jgi:DNA-binding XRE family transcriptional regulator
VGSQTEDTGRIKNGPIVETRTLWNDMQKGDECFIVGDRDGVYRFVEWFVYESGVECVELYGGPKGYAKTRFVGADAVTTDRAGRKRSAPVQEGEPVDQPTSPVGDYRARREELKLSRTALAELVGTTHAAVASVEAGRSARDKEAAAKMAAYLWPTGSIDAPVTKGCAGVMGMPDLDEFDDEDEDEWEDV